MFLMFKTSKAAYLNWKLILRPLKLHQAKLKQLVQKLVKYVTKMQIAWMEVFVRRLIILSVMCACAWQILVESCVKEKVRDKWYRDWWTAKGQIFLKAIYYVFNSSKKGMKKIILRTRSFPIIFLNWGHNKLLKIISDL